MTRLLVLFLLSAVPASAQLRIDLTDIPADTPDSATIYVAGSFNGWNPAAPGYELRARDGRFGITLPESVRGLIEFKFTLGFWRREFPIAYRWLFAND